MDHQQDFLSSTDFEDGLDDHRKDNSTKWLKSSKASLASLQQVKQVSVYNFGLSNQNDLKATNLTSQRSNSYTNLVPEPALQSTSSQKTAWGSNGSIPDAVKQNSKSVQRPGSAKTSARKYQPPTGKKQRPQSAKEGGVIQRGPGIAVKGAKYDPSGRPPKSFTATTGWIGPPAGMKFTDSRPESAKSDVIGRTPPPPTGTPIHIEVDLQSNITEDDVASPRLRYTHAEPQRTPTPPHVPPAPIHLMLPSMYDDVEDEDEDELDTDRLLQMAEHHIHADKKAECMNDLIEKVSSANHRVEDLPGFSYTHINGHTSQESKLEVYADGENEVLSWEKEDVNDSIDFADFESTVTPNTSPRSEFEVSHQPHPLEKISVKFSEDRNVTIDITPRNAGHKVSELTRKKSDIKLEDENNLQSYLSVSSANAHDNPAGSRNKSVSITEMKHDQKSVRTAPNNKSYTRSEKPTNENLEFKFTSQDNNARCERTLAQRPKSAVSNRPTTPLTSITVAYCDLDDAKKRRKRYRGLKSEKDVVTLVQQVQVSDSDEENNEVITPDKLEPWMKTKSTSQPTKNYYELSRQNTNYRKQKVASPVISGAPLVKTIKTIELAESGNDLKETKTQSFIDKQTSVFGEKDKQQREATRVRTKQRPASEMINRNPVKSEKEGILKTESDKKIDNSQKKPQRPFSAPSARQRPSSAKKDKRDKPKILGECGTDTAPPVNKNVDTTYVVPDDYRGVPEEHRGVPVEHRGEEYHDETYVISDHTTEDRSVVMETEQDEMSDISIEQEYGSDSENELKTDKDLEIEKIIERHLGKPSQIVTVSPTENKPPKSNKKPSKSPEKLSKEKKSTPHTHGQCNCPSQSKTDSKKVSTVTMHLHKDNREDKILNKVYGAYARGKSAPPTRHSSKPKTTERPRTAKPVYITSKIPNDDFETEENLECQQIQAKLAANGVNVKAETLERALYPPSGRTKYYEVNAQLPQNTSSNLLSHPREWLPIEYRQLRLAEKALNRANEMMYRQRMAEDRKARLVELAKKKVKGKKKGKGKKKEGTAEKIKF